MKVKEFVYQIVEDLVNERLCIDSHVRIRDQNGEEYDAGTVFKVLNGLGVLIEPIEDIHEAYCLLDSKTRKPISPHIFKFKKKNEFCFEI